MTPLLIALALFLLVAAIALYAAGRKRPDWRDGEALRPVVVRQGEGVKE